MELCLTKTNVWSPYLSHKIRCTNHRPVICNVSKHPKSYQDETQLVKVKTKVWVWHKTKKKSLWYRSYHNQLTIKRFGILGRDNEWISYYNAATVHSPYIPKQYIKKSLLQHCYNTWISVQKIEIDIDIKFCINFVLWIIFSKCILP